MTADPSVTGNVTQPSGAHRALTALAAGSVLLALNNAWEQAVSRSTLTGIVLAFGVVVSMVVIAIACAGRTMRTLVAADLATLLMGLAATAVSVGIAVRGTGPRTDEAVLIDQATRALAAGHNPYTQTWYRQVAADPTLLMNGHVADRFGYPPLMPLLSALVHRVAPGLSHPTTFVSFLALAATVAVLFVGLPAWARPLAVLVVFTASELPMLGVGGFPVVLMMFFLVAAVLRWTGIGRGGQLGRMGIAQAVALGLAASSQQQAWFVLPFLAVALWRIRRGELGARTAGLVVVRYLVVAGAVFAVVNAPFAVRAPRAWADGLLDPLRQHAIFFGPGLYDISVRLIGGSGDLGLYGDASVLLFVAALVALACWPQRLAAATFVVPFALFWFSLRSQSIYFDAAVPPVLVSIVTLDPAVIAAARPLWGRAAARRVAAGRVAAGRGTGGRLAGCARQVLSARVLVPGGCAVLGLALIVGAMISPAPLSLAVAGGSGIGRKRDLTQLEVTVVNTSDHLLAPHFATTVQYIQSLFWRVRSGPDTLAPGERAVYDIVPSRLQTGVLRPTTLWVVSDDPETLSSVRIPTTAIERVAGRPRHRRRPGQP